MVLERLEQPLENEYTGPMLLFSALAATLRQHGRHLLLITPLEAQDKPLWAARFESKLVSTCPIPCGRREKRPAWRWRGQGVGGGGCNPKQDSVVY